MPRVRLLELGVTSTNRAVRLLELSVDTTVIPPRKARLLDLRVTTIPAPKVRLLDLSVTTVVTLTANAGPDQTVDSQQRVYLSGLASGGWPTGFRWEQTTGPLVTLEPSADHVTPSFVAPATVDGTVIGMELTVSDGDNVDTTPDPVQITVLPHVEWIADPTNEWRPYVTAITGEGD